MSSEKQKKKDLREKFRKLRKTLHEKENGTARDLVAGSFFSFLPNIPVGTVIGAYYPMGSEIDSLRLMATLQINGMQVALPVVWKAADPMEFRSYRLGDALEEGEHKTLQPKADAKALEPEIIIVPLLAFDEKGNRLGRGAGHYDRTIAALRKKGEVLVIGLAFDGQKTKTLPVEKFDQALDGVLTEKGFWRFKKPGKTA